MINHMDLGQDQPKTKQQKKAEQNKRYRDKHHEILLEKQREYRQIRIVCSCGEEVRRNNLSDHVKMKKHIKKMQELEQQANV